MRQPGRFQVGGRRKNSQKEEWKIFQVVVSTIVFGILIARFTRVDYVNSVAFFFMTSSILGLDWNLF